MSVSGGQTSYYLLDLAALSKTVRSLWVDYATWTTALIDTILFGTGDQPAIRSRINKTTDEFVSLFSQFYGNEAGEKMRKLLSEYVDDLALMINAYANKDTVAISDLRLAMYAIADEFSRLLSQLNPNLDRATLQIMFYEVINSTENEITRTLAQEYEKSITARDDMLDQVYRIADELTFGLQRQFRL